MRVSRNKSPDTERHWTTSEGQISKINQLFECNDFEFATSYEYTMYRTVIDRCLENAMQKERNVKIEVAFPQIGKQYHRYGVPSLVLEYLIYIYSDGNPSTKSSEVGTIQYPRWRWKTEPLYNKEWKPLADAGTLPKRTPSLRLFFSSPFIADGQWIQFHGPGTLLHKIESEDKFSHIVLGCFTPVGKESSYSSLHSTYDDGGKLSEVMTTSDYKVEVRWECGVDDKDE